MAADTTPPDDAATPADGDPNLGGRIVPLSIEDELRGAYLTYSVSVIVSRALPDVRDGLKPSQRRILVAMNDLNLGPGSSRIKCAKISGDTSGNYHPHGEAVIYPTLVRMAQDWNMRHVLVDKQGNFGSNAGLPPAAMRYTEARLSAIGAAMLADLDQDTVDFVPTYDERNTEPVVLPSKFPNLIVNGANGIAVGMTTSIPPHNLSEICQALVKVIDDPEVSIDELMDICPGPDFPTGGVICGSSGVRRAYHTGQGTIVVRARARIEEMAKKRKRIIVTEIPFQQTRDPLIEKIAQLVNEERIKGVSAIRDESDYKDPVRIVIELKAGEDVDADVVLNQLYEFSPLQDTFSIILRALVDGKPRMLSFKDVLVEFLRHRLIVIRRRTQYQLLKARKRKHEVEGLLLAFANIDEIIRIIRTSTTQAEAKQRLQGVPAPSSMMERALGAEGFAAFQSERGVAEEYFLTPVQADAILAMRLGSLVNLEQDKLGENYRALLAEINECLRILSSDANVFAIIREDLIEMERRHRDARRTEISSEEVGDLNLEDLISEETMVVTLSTRGYIKRTPARTYQAQRRGGKGLKGATVEDDDPIEHLFVASTHAYLLFFTTKGKVYWKKVYDLPQLSREKKGRSIQQFVGFAADERIAACLAVRDFEGAERFLMMATRKGLVKKTLLSAYSRPQKGGIIAVKLREGDELVGAVVVHGHDELVLSTADGMAIRFSTADARSMGRNSSGVKGISLRGKDEVVALAVADAEATLLTVCEKGYGKRTPFGLSTLDPALLAAAGDGESETEEELTPSEAASEAAEAEADAVEEAEEEDGGSSGRRYRTQRRGGKGIRDIKTTTRNGKVVAAVPVHEDGEVLMISSKGKIQRIAVREITVVGRNTQGVRIMKVDDDDRLAAVVPVPREEDVEAVEVGETVPPPALPGIADESISTNGSGGTDE